MRLFVGTGSKGATRTSKWPNRIDATGLARPMRGQWPGVPLLAPFLTSIFPQTARGSARETDRMDEHLASAQGASKPAPQATEKPLRTTKAPDRQFSYFAAFLFLAALSTL